MSSYKFRQLNTIFVTLSIILGFFIHEMESLQCYKCLNLDCPEGERDEKNYHLCQSVRSFIVKSMSSYYEMGAAGYIGPCPSLDETLQWTFLQHGKESCPYIREKATCSLGRLQIITKENDKTIISHATILGCVQSALLNYIQTYTQDKTICSIMTINSTAGIPQTLILENCPKVTDYCYSKSFCVPYTESIVKPFYSKKNSNTFEAGTIIAIISVVIVLIVIGFLASFCKNPLNRTSNYSPGQIQDNSIAILKIEAKNSDAERQIPSSTTKHDVLL